MNEHTPKLQKAYDNLIDELCVKYGWCGSRIDGKFKHVDDFVPKSGYLIADDFAVWVILADGEDPEGDRSNSRGWKAKIKQVFIKHLGNKLVPISELGVHDDS